MITDCRLIMEINIHAKSTSKPEEPYEVTFLFKDNRLSVLCNCPAGEWGKLCKHKTALISNDDTMLFVTDELPLLEQAQELIQKTSLMDVFTNLDIRRKELESQQRKIKKELSNIKSQLGRMLHEGID